MRLAEYIDGGRGAQRQICGFDAFFQYIGVSRTSVSASVFQAILVPTPPEHNPLSALCVRLAAAMWYVN